MSVSILRIKRKRTGELPLDALVIEHNQPNSKRQRNTESARGIFRFAETIPLDSFDTETSTRQVSDRITAYLAHPPRALSRPASSASLYAQAQSVTPRKLPSRLNSNFPTSGSASPKERILQDKVKGFHEESKRARYRIIEQRRAEEQIAFEMRRGPLPPVVRDSKVSQDTPIKGMRIYDAVEESSSSNLVNILPGGPEDVANDQFVSMLQEYLTLQARVSSTPITTSMPKPEEIKEMDDDFVYDVYYRDITATANSIAIEAASAGEDVGSGAGLKRIGELAGLEEDEILSNEVEEEEEDEADQDSNEENDYRNDYPSGESESESDSDDEY